MEKFKEIFNPTVRRWLYRVLLAVIPILTATGVLTEELAPLVVGLVGAILAIGLADANVPEAPDYKSFEERKSGNPFYWE